MATSRFFWSVVPIIVNIREYLEGRMKTVKFNLRRAVEQEVLDKLVEENTFYHSFSFTNGMQIDGWYEMESTVNDIGFPDLEGKRVLDIGPASGF